MPLPVAHGKALPQIQRAFHHDLLRWYRRHHRKLPWRATRDPYKIWVSEVMLQQTRVTVVRDYYDRWIRVFPNIEALARAPYDRVLKLWEGLGYYSRARNLHRAAQSISDVFHKRSINKFVQLVRLPGIGRYTAGAVASIAFGERVPVVDGNVARVLSRVFDIRTDIRKSATQRRFWKLADSLVPQNDPGQFNQAMMEVGALLCTPLSPRCDICPLNRVCLARARGTVVRLPNRGRPRKPKSVTHDAVLVRNGAKVLLQRRPSRGLLAGLWELPSVKTRRFRRGRQVLTLRHTITDRRILLRVFESRLKNSLKPDGTWCWASSTDLTHLVMPAAHRRALEQLLHQR